MAEQTPPPTFDPKKPNWGPCLAIAIVLGILVVALVVYLALQPTYGHIGTG